MVELKEYGGYDMAREAQSKRIVPPSDYKRSKSSVQRVLKRTKQPLTRAEIKEKAGFEQKVPNNKWVKRMEEDIGLFGRRQKKEKLYGGYRNARY